MRDRCFVTFFYCILTAFMIQDIQSFGSLLNRYLHPALGYVPPKEKAAQKAKTASCRRTGGRADVRKEAGRDADPSWTRLPTLLPPPARAAMTGRGSPPPPQRTTWTRPSPQPQLRSAPPRRICMRLPSSFLVYIGAPVRAGSTTDQPTNNS
jgi:hypothetical protein